MSIPKKQFLSIGEVAARFGVAKRTLLKWEKDGLIALSWFYTPGGHKRMPLKDVERIEKLIYTKGFISPKGVVTTNERVTPK